MRAQINHLRQENSILLIGRELVGLLFISTFLLYIFSYLKPPGDTNTNIPKLIDATKKYDNLNDAQIASAGMMCIQIVWPAFIDANTKTDADVDLWVLGPDGMSIGYSSQGSLVGNLLRDDLGNDVAAKFGDAANSETTVLRVTPSGKYVINVHLYANRSGLAVIPVTLYITKMNKSLNKMETFLPDRKVELHHEGEELTIVAFTLDDKGQIAAGSLNAAFEPVRSRMAK